MRLNVLTLLVLTLLAGCVSPAQTGAGPPESAPADSPQKEGDPVPAEAHLNESAVPLPRVESFFWNGTVTGVGYNSQILCCPTVQAPDSANARVEFPVAADATRVVVTLTWATGTADLDPFLEGADFEQYDLPRAEDGGIRGSNGRFWYNDNGQPGAGDSPAVLEAPVTGEALIGTWHASVGPKLAVNEAFQLRVDVEYGAPPRR